MARLGGHLLVDCLRALGATKAFGVPGESYLAVLDALHDTGGALDFILCRQEGGAAFMAAAWGKLTGTPGVCLVTRGPGATNAAIGVHTAMQDSSPLLLFVGQVATSMKGREAFQELDYTAVFGTMAKWAVEIDNADRIPEIVAKAWRTAVTGRPGPVVVALPEDVLTTWTKALPIGPLQPIHSPHPAPSAVAEARARLAGAHRPLILCAGAPWREDDRAALQAFAEASDIPVAAVFRYQDQFDNTSPSFVGEAGVGMMPWVRRMMGEADVILALGPRFGENSTDGYTLLDVPIPQQYLIHVHASAAELGKTYQPHLGIHADAGAMAQALADAGAVRGDWAAWRATGRSEYEAGLIAPPQPSPVDMAAVMQHMQDVLPADAILTNGAGNFAIWPNKHFCFRPGQRLIAPQSGSMGYGLPAAIAAQIAAPDRTVVCFAGDGDFQMTSQELATARQANACPIVLILNNGIYGTIRAHQEKHYPTRVSGTDMVSPDFAALARSYGFLGERVDETGDFAAAFDRALASPTGAVLDLTISAEALTPRMTLSAIRTAGQTAPRT